MSINLIVSLIYFAIAIPAIIYLIIGSARMDAFGLFLIVIATALFLGV